MDDNLAPPSTDTDASKGENSFEKRERRFRLLVEGATNFAMLLMDRNGRVISWNEGARRIFGYKAEEVLGQHVALIFTPEDRTSGVPEQELSTARDQGIAPDVRWHLCKDGTRFWADGIMERITSEAGDFEGYAKILRDATADKLARDWEHARFVQIFEQAPAFMARLRGPQHVFDLTNPIYDQLIGHRNVVGQSVADALPEVVAQGFIGILDQVYQTGRAYVAKDVSLMRQVNPNGPLSEVTVDFTYQPLFDEDGTVSGILVHGVDRTVRKQQERQFQETLMALDHAEERLRLATSSAQIGTWDYDILQDELFADVNCRAAFGFPLDGPLKFASFLAQIHPEDRVIADKAIADVFSPGSSGDYAVEYRVIGFLDGVERWVRVEGKAFFDASRTQAVRFLGVTRDVTQAKRHEQEVERVLADTRARAVRENLLHQIGEAVRETLEPEIILQSVVTLLGQGLNADRCYFVRSDVERDTARVFPEWIRAEVGLEPFASRTFHISAYAINRNSAYRAGRTHVINDI